ncbi:MAG: amidohydrolase family protein, partial [Candidatus Auribacterota bacterium]|nr:amidohydrolase family protein [Candidatus Auribacterota bacterium]
IFAHDLHTCWANTKAVELAGLLHKMPPYPPLIKELDFTDNFILGSDKMPSGEFREPEVYFFVSGPIAAKFPRPITKQLDDLETVCRQLAALGITGVHRMALAQPSQDIALILLILELDQRGRLPIRIATSCGSVADTHMLYDVEQGYLIRNALARARRKEMTMAELHDYLVELLKDSGTTRQRAIEEIARRTGATGELPYINRFREATEHIHNSIHGTYVKTHAERENPHRKENLPEYIRDVSKVRCDTIKIFMDGVVEKKTAYRLDQKPEEGVPEFKQGELDALLEYADRFGMQVAAHSIGNGSVRSMLDAISRAHQKNRAIDRKRGHRIPHRIEHIEMCKAEDVPKFGREHIVASMQPLHERPPVTMWHKLVPKKDWNSSFAWKEILGDGAVIVFGSDWPIVSCDVREGIHHATTRKPWLKGEKQQKLTIQQALNAYTTGAAFTEYSGKIKGKIQPGMLADIVILSDNVNKLQEEEQPEIDIQTTICNGEIVYEKE